MLAKLLYKLHAKDFYIFSKIKFIGIITLDFKLLCVFLLGFKNYIFLPLSLSKIVFYNSLLFSTNYYIKNIDVNKITKFFNFADNANLVYNLMRFCCLLKKNEFFRVLNIHKFAKLCNKKSIYYSFLKKTDKRIVSLLSNNFFSTKNLFFYTKLKNKFIYNFYFVLKDYFFYYYEKLNFIKNIIVLYKKFKLRKFFRKFSY